MWVEDLEWIEDDKVVDAVLGGVLVLFNSAGVSGIDRAVVRPLASSPGVGLKRLSGEE
jgi:hypothetical protein